MFNMNCKTAIYGIYRIKTIRFSLTQDAVETLALGIFMSHIDYANAFFLGLPQLSMMKLQRIQNMAARVALGHRILVVVYKALSNVVPKYIRAMLTLSTAVRTTSSNSQYQKLKIPITKRNIFADRTFSVQGPQRWNQLPNVLRQCTTFYIFKSNLKHYFL